MSSTRKSGTLFWLNVLLDCEELDPTETLLLIALADHVDEHDQAFPSLQLLARRARVSYATAKRRMASLEERGYVARSRRHGSGGRRSTYTYRLIRDRFGLTTRVQVEPWEGPDRVQSAPRSRAHPDEPTEVPRSELEEEEQPDAASVYPEPDDRLVADLAQRLLELRDADLPDRPVRQRAGWLKKTRRGLRNDTTLPKAAQQARHPALGCMGDRNRQVEALAHRKRTDSWPAVPSPRRIVQPDVSTDVDTTDQSEERTPMPASVRDALTGARR